MAATLGEDEGVLAIDGTDIPKDRPESVGVARQYWGQMGKRANCQAAVCAALVDRRLYLSRDWVSGSSHADRRRTGVPANTPFRTKPQLALEMLTALVAEGSLPVRWVTCDEDFSVSPAILDGAAGLGLGYLAEVARNTQVWTARPQTGGFPSQEVSAVVAQLPPAAWRKLGLREGSKARRGLFPGPDIWLLLRRNPATDELKCYLSNGPTDLAPERLVWLAGLH